MRGVDVSYFNYRVNWCELYARGYEFAICRTGFGRNGIDETFARHVADAHMAGLICGAYHYSYALNIDDAIAEAEHCKSIIEDSGLMLELPVFLDMEDGDGYKCNHNFKPNRRNVTEICRAFLEHMQPLNCGVYASYYWLLDYVDYKTLGCPIWSAQWNGRDDFGGYMWQCRDDLLVDGTLFDENVLYDDKDKWKSRSCN